MEHALSPPLNPIILSPSDQILTMELLKWCSNNLVNVGKPKPSYDNLKLTTANGNYYLEQLITSTIPHKISFKWFRTFGKNIESDIKYLYNKDIVIYLHNLYGYAQVNSNDFLILLN